MCFPRSTDWNLKYAYCINSTDVTGCSQVGCKRQFQSSVCANRLLPPVHTVAISLMWIHISVVSTT
jgi:hypothetical protein